VPQPFVSLNYHQIFSTKGREPWLGEEWRPRLYDYVGGILRADGGQLLAAGGVSDHVHYLVSLRQTTSLAETLKIVKARSSIWVHETFPGHRGFAWQAGYGAFSVSRSNLVRVESYILRQAEHHRTRTFQEEFVVFLKRHGIVYDERHLWD
jgi:REP element-mobilizing transposase RayT